MHFKVRITLVAYFSLLGLCVLLGCDSSNESVAMPKKPGGPEKKSAQVEDHPGKDEFEIRGRILFKDPFYKIYSPDHENILILQVPSDDNGLNSDWGTYNEVLKPLIGKTITIIGEIRVDRVMKWRVKGSPTVVPKK